MLVVDAPKAGGAAEIGAPNAGAAVEAPNPVEGAAVVEPKLEKRLFGFSAFKLIT